MSAAATLAGNGVLSDPEAYAVAAAIADAPQAMAELLFGVPLSQIEKSMPSKMGCTRAAITQYGLAIRAGVGNDGITSLICSVVSIAAKVVDADPEDAGLNATGVNFYMSRTIGQLCLPGVETFVASLVAGDDQISAADGASMASGLRAAMIMAPIAYNVSGALIASGDEFGEAWDSAMDNIGFPTTDIPGLSSTATLLANPSPAIAGTMITAVQALPVWAV